MINKYIEFAKGDLKENEFITFPEDLFAQATPEDAVLIAQGIDTNALMLLPEKEIEFFEWLREQDLPVWNDLWIDDEIPPYLVSVSFLPFLVYQSPSNGFPICDLQNSDNYYFTISMMIADHSQTVLEAAKERFTSNQELDLHQILALEIAFNSTDIWHFAYKYGITLEAAKQALNILVSDKAIIHPLSAVDVAQYIQF